ncbi:MAG: alpha/beta fold hydrolase [Pseudoruegeria sp.]
MTMQYPRLADTLPTIEEVSFHADTARLSGKLYRPGLPPKAAIVLHPATGVPQGFYAPFARWLSEQGYACLTYDYRDIGESLTQKARASQATMAVWGRFDQVAAQIAMEGRVPGVPIWVIGHSIGGLMIPFQSESAPRIKRMITVASGPVHFKDHPWIYKPVTALFWYVLGPLLTSLMGYLPGRILGLGLDLPSGVYWQWRRWCTSHGFYLNDAGSVLPYPDYRAFGGDLKVVAASDDPMVPPSAVWRLMQLYPDAHKTQLTLKPETFGGRAIGHIGMFRKGNEAMWAEMLR